MEARIRFLKHGQSWTSPESGDILDFAKDGNAYDDASMSLITLRNFEIGDKIRVTTKGTTTGRVRGTVKYLGRARNLPPGVPPALSITTTDAVFYNVTYPYNIALSLVGIGGIPPYDWCILPWTPEPNRFTLPNSAVVGEVLEGTLTNSNTFQVRLHMTDSSGAYTEKIVNIGNTAIPTTTTAGPTTTQAPTTTAAPTTIQAPTTAGPTTTQAPTTAGPTTTQAPTTTAAPTTTTPPDGTTTTSGPTPVNDPPVIHSLGADGSGTRSGNITLTANVTDDVAVEYVDFFLVPESGGADIGVGSDYYGFNDNWSVTFNSAYYVNNLLGNTGNYHLKARAYDGLGLWDQFETVSTIPIFNDTLKPGVGWVSPTGYVPRNISIPCTLQAWDTVGIAAVKVFNMGFGPTGTPRASASLTGGTVQMGDWTTQLTFPEALNTDVTLDCYSYDAAGNVSNYNRVTLTVSNLYTTTTTPIPTTTPAPTTPAPTTTAVPQTFLSVSRGTGVSGTPIGPTVSGNVGWEAFWNYGLEAGYTNLVVTWDGTTPVAAAGSAMMDVNHSISATATIAAPLSITEPAANLYYSTLLATLYHTFSITPAGSGGSGNYAWYIIASGWDANTLSAGVSASTYVISPTSIGLTDLDDLGTLGIDFTLQLTDTVTGQTTSVSLNATYHHSIIAPCPAPWVPLTLADGTQKLAKDIKVGDMILAQTDACLTDVYEPFQVEVAFPSENETALLTAEDGRMWEFSVNHKVRTANGWTEVQNLKKGTKIYGPDPAIVQSVKLLGKNPVIKIEVGVAHTYINNGILSHNFKTPTRDSVI